jgi:hypothetical protein
MFEVIRKPQRVIVLKTEADVKQAKETLWLCMTLMENHFIAICEKGDGSAIKEACEARSMLQDLLNATGNPGEI